MEQISDRLHNVQKTLIESVNHQMLELDERMRDKDSQIDHLQTSKTETGVALFRAKQDVDRLNSTLQSLYMQKNS